MAQMRGLFESKNLNKKPPRLMTRRSEALGHYLNSLVDHGKMLTDMVTIDGICYTPTVREMRGKGKKVGEIKAPYEHTRIELDANAPNNVIKAGSLSLIDSIEDSNTAKKHNLDVMPEKDTNPYEEAAKNMYNTVECRKILKLVHKEDKELCKSITTMPKGDDSRVKKCLLNMIVEHWTTEFKDGPPLKSKWRIFVDRNNFPI
jgi:hypothetical protein